MTISLCMIVKDAKKTLKVCLDSVKDIVDEIIIVDTGSTDETKQIAKGYTDKIFDMQWENDFAKARNISFSYATKDYIMWLDADDVIEKEEGNKLKALKTLIDEKTDVVLMNYYVDFDKKGNVLLSYYRERLIKRALGAKWVEPVHEVLEVKGNMIYSDIYITHTGRSTGKTRNLEIYEGYLKAGNSLSNRGTLYYGRELFENKQYEKARQIFEGILENQSSNGEECANACLMIAYCNKSLKEVSLPILYESFKYTEPRKEICYEIAEYYMEEGVYEKAIFWYELTLDLPENIHKISAQYYDYDKYLPHLGLCRCYALMGDIEQAIYHNEEAGKVKVNDYVVLRNREILKQGGIE
ncbi:MAG: tetratricopeptide repeat-containing glycosyltransferase family 2 protein [Cellulosilyticaceae bacterium]